MDRTAFVRSLKELSLELDEAQLSAFEGYEEALYRANEVANLTRVPREECWLRHFVDSLLIAEFIPEDSKVLDIGAGPGLPAWPLACARPDIEVTGLDSSGKMFTFLQSQPLPNLTPVLDRAEAWRSRADFDVVTGRALAPLAIQLELSALHCRKGGTVVPMRTAADEPKFESPEISRIGLKFEVLAKKALPGTDIVRYFPIYRRTGLGLKARTWAEMRRAPIFE